MVLTGRLLNTDFEDAILHVSLHVEDTKPLRGLKH